MTAKLNTRNNRIQQEEQKPDSAKGGMPAKCRLVSKQQRAAAKRQQQLQQNTDSKVKWDLWLLIWQLLNQNNANSKPAKQRHKKPGLLCLWSWSVRTRTKCARNSTSGSPGGSWWTKFHCVMLPQGHAQVSQGQGQPHSCCTLWEAQEDGWQRWKLIYCEC